MSADFNGMAKVAAAINAEEDARTRAKYPKLGPWIDAINRCRELSLTTEPPTWDGMLVFNRRARAMPHDEMKLEQQAREAVVDGMVGKRIEPHWSDDPRIESQAHFDAVKAGTATLRHPNGNAEYNDRDGIDHHAAKHSHDGAGLRIL